MISAGLVSPDAAASATWFDKIMWSVWAENGSAPLLNEYENYAENTSFEELFEQSAEQWSDTCKTVFAFWAFGITEQLVKSMGEWDYTFEYKNSLIREQKLVYGKIPLKEYKRILSESIHNRKSPKITLGKYFDGTIESGSYIAKAEATGDAYFSLGDKWNEIKKLYGFTNEEMFQIFNTKALDYAVETGKTIRFTQDPRLYIGSSLYDEWVYLQTKYDYYDLLLDEGYYYAIK